MSDSIEITRQADADLREIFEHIAMELHSLQGAENLLAKLENKSFRWIRCRNGTIGISTSRGSAGECVLWS